jgi:hypothetical protein
MGCPVHIWLPAMAALAPVARVARDRVRAFRSVSTPEQPARVVRRFAPVGAVAASRPATPERNS